MKQTFPEKLEILANNERVFDKCAAIARGLERQIISNPPTNVGEAFGNLLRALAGVALVGGSVYFGAENLVRFAEGRQLRTS